MPFIDLDTGIRMHYRDGGDGKPIVFLPGFSATVDSFNYAVLELADRFRCICVDMRGHGETEKPVSAYTYDELCGDVGALLRALDLRDVTLVGWSMAAGIALKYVTELDEDRRVSKLALVGSATPCFTQTNSEPFGMDAATAAALEDGIRTAFPEAMAALADQNFHRTDLETTKQWFLSHWLTLPAYAAYPLFKSLVGADLRENLARVEIPTILLHGRHDPVCHPGWIEYMADRIPGTRIVWFEDSSHALMVEEPEKFGQELAAFVGQPATPALNSATSAG